MCSRAQTSSADFKNKLEKYGINVTIRREMGRDIDGACGQLRRSYMEAGTKERKKHESVIALTDIGRSRSMNQDYVFVSETPVGNLPNLFVVADGMGGHKAGDTASRVYRGKLLATVSEEARRRIPSEYPDCG